HRTLLELTGKDVQSFLQGQFSNDINTLEQGVVQLNAYCQHQGKIIALIWVMKKNESFYLSFPSDLTEIVVKRLSMFKMMSDVVIVDISNEFVQLGMIDDDFKGAFKLNNHQSVILVESASNFELADERLWVEACIENNIAEVTLDTSEQFVPQLLNLDIDEVGVSFTKGCYPGQEVVARLHYLGKSKRRLRMFECEADLSVGDKLFALSSSSAKASGVVVRRVILDEKSLCLATIEIAHEDDQITLNDAQGAQLTRISRG
ncbi:folate-binding protein YgfZ, partial [Candidatus Thioglobus sp.]|nr:folate-binding protein YgfZ [Candidatus Thioglobus sp.]MDC1165969.1 folate-binding protein YgfZ [Candidatus Thioglobus sp.]